MKTCYELKQFFLPSFLNENLPIFQSPKYPRGQNVLVCPNCVLLLLNNFCNLCKFLFIYFDKVKSLMPLIRVCLRYKT